jgi:hypothetical protein
MDQNRQRTFYRNITQEFETMIFTEKDPNQYQLEAAQPQADPLTLF